MGSTVFERQPPRPSVITYGLAGSRQGIYWLEDLPDRDQRPPLLGVGDRADLVVVGGGYCGLWTAIRAVQRTPGIRVVVLEAVRTGWAASGRNGGFCEASLTHGHANGLSRWPDEIDELERLGHANLDAIERDVGEWGLDVELERTGSIDVAVEPHQVAWAEEDRGRPGVRLLDQDAVRRAVSSPTYLAGVWDTLGCAMVHPGKLAAGLAEQAERMGVVIHEGTTVTELEAGSSGPVTVRTEDGSIAADRVALATNVFPSLLRRNRLRTVPVYDYALMTEPLSAERMAAIGWEGRQGLSDSANNFHYYRLTADNRILWGGYDAVYHYGGKVRASYEDRPEVFEMLAGHFFTTFPQLEGTRFTHRWAGAIDSSTRFCAFYGVARRGRVAYAAGFTGLGVGATRFAADVMLDLLDGAETERTSLKMVRERPVPFPPEPFAALGINATRWSMERADRIEGRRNLFLRTLDKWGLGFDS